MVSINSDLERAIASQIKAEIAGAGTNVKAIAKVINVDYSALRKYLYLAEPHRSMPLRVLLGISDALRIEASEIIVRARRRAGQG